MHSASVKLVWIPALLAVLAGCEPVLRTHGYTPAPEKLDTLSAGTDTRASVQRKIGRPAFDSIFSSDDAWYYVASTVREETYKAPRVIDRRVVAVRFDSEGTVESVGRYGLEDGRVIDLATRTTPTYGSQLTILEQIFSNLRSPGTDTIVGGEN